jgi:ABC-type glycerol-3-phosphate transport system substrate-binding protein
MCYWGLLQHLVEKNAALYNTKHTGAPITTTGRGNDYIGYLRERFTHPHPPDFVQLFNDVNAHFQWKGWVGVLEDHIPEAAKYKKVVSNKQYLKSMLTPDGRVQALIYYGAHAAFMYNRKHLESAGLGEAPKEWDELVSHAKKVKAMGINEFPLVLGLSGPGYIEALYSLMLGMNPKQSSYLFDEDFNTLFDDEKSSLFVTLRWAIDAIHKDKILATDCVRLGAFDATYAMGQMKHTFSWLPRYVLPIICFMSMSRNVSQALNPGYGYTSCYIRLYTPSQEALQSNSKRLEQVWKAMQYFGGKTDDQLEPNLTSGKFRVMKSMMMDSGIPSPPDDLLKDEEYCKELDRWSPMEITKEQDKKVYNALCDPWTAPWYNEWADEWGRGSFKRSVHKLLLKGADNKELLAELRKLAVDWNRLKRNYAKVA